MTPADIARLVPQTGLMCLLDRVAGYDDQHIICTASSHRSPHHPLALADGRLLSVISLEYAAQAAAAHGSLLAAESASAADSHVRSGFLASARDFKLHVRRIDDLTEDLVVRAERVMDTGSSVLYAFGIESDGRPVSEGRLAVFFTRAN